MDIATITVNQSEPEEIPETVEIPAIAATQREPEEVSQTVKTPAIPATQSEPEEVAETVETLPFQLIRANERGSQRPWRLCHCS